MSALHREHPEATEDEILALAAAALLRAPSTPLECDEPRVGRECRDCGQPFTVPASKVDVNSKWYALCGSCLAYEV